MTDPKLYRRLLRRRLTWVVLAAGMVVVVVGALVFEPWKLFVDQRVDESVPGGARWCGGGLAGGPGPRRADQPRAPQQRLGRRPAPPGRIRVL
jgi:hypothetical protein